MQIIEVSKELSEAKSNGLQIILQEMMSNLDKLHEIYAMRRTREEHAALSLWLLQGAFAVSRIAVLATLFQKCSQNDKLNARTWSQIHFN